MADTCPRHVLTVFIVCAVLYGVHGQSCDLSAEDSNRRCAESPGRAVCAGFGDCVCGVCECHNNPVQFYGQYCECDDHACDYYEGLICGGPDRAVCECGQCVCTPQYTGASCECLVSEETCTASNGNICNNKGRCVCGRCECDSVFDDYYIGPTCEDCPTCPGKCDSLKDCVRCQVFASGPLTAEACHTQCVDYELSTVQILTDGPGSKRCMFRDDDDCTFTFSYMYLTTSILVQVQTTKECPAPLVTASPGSGACPLSPGRPATVTSLLVAVVALRLLWE